MVLERKFSWICFKNNIIFFHLSPTSSHFHPLQVGNCGSNSRLVVDEDDNGKLMLERVKRCLFVVFDTKLFIGISKWHIIMLIPSISCCVCNLHVSGIVALLVFL